MLIRPLTIDDTPTLLPWRNDELTRAMSRTNTFIIDLESYRTVVGGWLALPTTHAYIAEIDGVPIGTIRLEEKEVSYTVAPEHRGKGYATEMLRWAVERSGRYARKSKWQT